jgi:hypothetical protein
MPHSVVQNEPRHSKRSVARPSTDVGKLNCAWIILTSEVFAAAIHSALQGPLAAPGSVKQFMKPVPQKQFVGSPEEVHVCECAVSHVTTAAQSARSAALVSAQQPSVPPRAGAASEQFMVVQSSHAAVLAPP